MKLSDLEYSVIKRVFSYPTFGPVDCPNFINFKRVNMYRVYSILLFPLLLAVGGRVHYVGDRVKTFYGKSPSDLWMLIRYPNHRIMMAMLFNPYYFLISFFHEKGVKDMEIAYTQMRGSKKNIKSSKNIDKREKSIDVISNHALVGDVTSACTI